MANEPFMDRWTLNGTEVLLQDHGRDQANGVPVLDNEAKLPLSYLPQNYASNLKVSPDDPDNDDFDVWLTKLNSSLYRDRGKTWTAGVNISSVITTNVVLFKDLYIIASGAGPYWSTDGIAWNAPTNFPSSTLGLFICCNENLCLVGSGKGIWASTDGKNWTLCNGIPNTYSVRNIVYVNGLWLCGIQSHGVWWSEDGINWTQGTGSAASGGGRYWEFVYADGLYVCFNNQSGGVFWSEDGKSWNSCTGVSGAIGTSLSYKDGLWLMSSGPSWDSTNPSVRGILWSEDGKSWTRVSLNNFYAHTVKYIKNLWFAETTNGGIWWSEDGKNWAQGSGVSNHYIANTDYANGVFLTCIKQNNSNPAIYWSDDGKTWNTSASAPVLLYFLAFLNGVWLTISNQTDNGGIWYSENGKSNWYHASGASKNLAYLMFVKNVFFELSNNPHTYESGSGNGIYSSTSLGVWTPEISA